MVARIALLSMGRHFFDTDHAGKTVLETESALRGAGLDTHRIGGTITTGEEAGAAAKALADLGEMDLIVVQYGTFALWSHLEGAIGGSRCPVVIWVVPEPESETGRLRLNSMCGANLGANHLYLHGRWFRAVFGPSGDDRAIRLIQQAARAAHARNALRGARLGVIGGPPDGFYPWRAWDEWIRSRYGVEVVHVPIERLIREAKAVGPADIEKAGNCFAGIGGLQAIDPGQLERSLRLSAAAQGIVHELELAATAFRCWPEIPEEYGCAACLALSRLGADGVPSACEADVYGGLTLMILRALTGETPALMDLVSVSGPNAVFWHCGAAPLSCLSPGQAQAMVHPNRKVGVGLDAEFGWDAVTCARIGIDRDGEDRLILFEGKRGQMPRHFQGTSSAIDVGGPAIPLMERLFNLGVEHHYGLVGQDVRSELICFCDMLGMKVFDLSYGIIN